MREVSIAAMTPEFIDDAAVDKLAAALKARLREKREAGRHGWWTPECDGTRLNALLHRSIKLGDPVNVAAYTAFMVAKGVTIDADPQLVALRNFANAVYAAGAELGLPEQWLDVAYAAGSGQTFDPEPLLPYVHPGRASERQVDFVKRNIQVVGGGVVDLTPVVEVKVLLNRELMADAVVQGLGTGELVGNAVGRAVEAFIQENAL